MNKNVANPDNGILIGSKKKNNGTCYNRDEPWKHAKWKKALIKDHILYAVQLLSLVQLFVTPRTAACQASLSFTISLSLLKLMSFEYILYDSTHIKSRRDKSIETNSRFIVA